jgi:hypothetical protein
MTWVAAKAWALRKRFMWTRIRLDLLSNHGGSKSGAAWMTIL